MRCLIAAVAPLLFAAPALAQEVSVPAVTTASPGGYANPLQLDTDRYRRANGNGQQRQARPFGTCNQEPMTQERRNQLELGYLQRARGNAMNGWRWVRDQCGAMTAQSIERSAKRRAAGR